ncbi:uncharacterized protein EKO05_0011137 [Ascochyta rabiei]|uniref:uncharacterized protein n=1 Tax=Didymella rabiei TaxID=5454 RepID=UPI002206C11C|nr:uncharacterized protein EKO05_0011137 [Ascochyta rabiei]UPX20927.1 hypothetical protein EKO05_0011137 [Ascochyta rabiei]
MTATPGSNRRLQLPKPALPDDNVTILCLATQVRLGFLRTTTTTATTTTRPCRNFGDCCEVNLHLSTSATTPLQICRAHHRPTAQLSASSPKVVENNAQKATSRCSLPIKHVRECSPLPGRLTACLSHWDQEA